MTSASSSFTHTLFTFKWHPSRDLTAIAVSWLLVVAALWTATFVAGSQRFGGMLYFALYAVVGALICGVGIPLWWTVAVRRRPVSDLGLTRNLLVPSLLLQLLFVVLQTIGAYRGLALPSFMELLPLVALALTIGFFEALFWRGWVLLRLEDAFGFLPALLLGSLLYAAYHIGYGMKWDEMAFLFFIGLMYGAAFRITRSVFILWPLFQPSGQLVTLIKDGLYLPPLAALGFFEVLIAMWVLVWLAARYYRKHAAQAR